jgi:hypothetical protein
MADESEASTSFGVDVRTEIQKVAFANEKS